jgi:perosamine synthetase
MPDSQIQIGVGAASISALQRRYVNQALKANRLSYGPFTERFEAEFARRHDCKFAVFTNSGTSALQVAVHAMKLRFGWADGDEILVPAVTFVASANVVLQNGLKPVFVDVDPDYFELNPAKLRDALTSRTRAIMPVHIGGLPCDMDPIVEFAKEHGLRLIEDSCETMFARYHGRSVGSFGDVACFSTYVAHIVVTGVGGLALTNDPDLAVLMKSLFNHGRDSIYLHIDDDRDVGTERLFEIVSRRFKFVEIGYSYRGTELEGALGLGELARIDSLLAARKRNADYLLRKLRPLERSGLVQLPKRRPESDHVFMFFPVVARDPSLRDKLVYCLEERGVETRYLLPLIDQPIYRRLFGDLDEKLPVAARLNKTAFYVGCHPFLKRSELKYIVESFYACLS